MDICRYLNNKYLPKPLHIHDTNISPAVALEMEEFGWDLSAGGCAHPDVPFTTDWNRPCVEVG